jgi:hypothetical protein
MNPDTTNSSRPVAPTPAAPDSQQLIAFCRERLAADKTTSTS